MGKSASALTRGRFCLNKGVKMDRNEKFEPRDRRSADWFWVHKMVWANSVLSAADKVLYGTMALFANGNSQRLFPSVATMEKFSGLSERQVRRSLAKLEEVNLIEIERNPGRSSAYILLDVSGAKLAGVPKAMQGGAKSGGGVVPNNSTNKNNKQELINNSDNLSTDGEKPVENSDRNPAKMGEALDGVWARIGVKPKRAQV